MAELVHSVTGGPSIDDLASSLFTGKQITFTLADLGDLPGVVHMIRAENDQDRNALKLEGVLLTNRGRTNTLFEGPFDTHSGQGSFTTYFPSTEERAAAGPSH